MCAAFHSEDLPKGGKPVVTALSCTTRHIALYPRIALYSTILYRIALYSRALYTRGAGRKSEGLSRGLGCYRGLQWTQTGGVSAVSGHCQEIVRPLSGQSQ